MNTQTQIPIDPHTYTSASNAGADRLCPGRFNAQRGLPDRPSPDAEFGTQIHHTIAHPDDTAALTKLTLEQREIRDACKEIEAKVVNGYLGAVGNSGDPLRVWRHRRFWLTLKGEKGPLRHSGEADVARRYHERMMILDYKCLPGEVAESSRNEQLRDLAVLACGEEKTVTEVAVAIVQPLVTHSPEVCVYGAADLTRAANEMVARLLRSNDPASPRVAGEVQCKYCKAKPNCQEYQRFAGAMLPAMLTVLDVPVAQWKPEHRAIFCERRAIAQKWLDDVVEAMKEGLASDPGYVPGWGLKAGAVKPSITDPQACFDRFAALGGSVKQFMGAVTVGKTKLREAVHALTGAKGQKLDKAIGALTEGIIAEKQNAPSLVKVDEK
jgi:hypothetical protein